MSNSKGSRACIQVARVRSMPNATCRFRGFGSTRVRPRRPSSAHERCVGAHTAKNLRWSGRVRTDAAEEDLPTRDRPPSSLLPHGPMARRQLAGRVQVGAASASPGPRNPDRGGCPHPLHQSALASWRSGTRPARARPPSPRGRHTPPHTPSPPRRSCRLAFQLAGMGAATWMHRKDTLRWMVRISET